MQRKIPYLLLLLASIFVIFSCDSGGSEEDTTPKPTVDFSFSPTDPVAGQQVSFTSTVTNATSYSWSSNPAGFTSTAANPTYTFATAGSYTINLSVTGPGGTSQTSKTITVAAPAPTADFSFTPANPKVGQSVAFTSTVANVTSYAWSSNPAGFSSTQANPQHTFSATGTYQITLEATGPGGTVTETKAITVTADAPVVGFSFAPTAPKINETVTFTNTTVNATTYAWSSVPAGFTSTAENPQHQFATAGTYAVTLTATGPGGSESLTQNVVVADLDPIAGFNFSPSNPLIGQEVTFTNTSQNATSYQWSSVPAGFSSTEANPKYTFATPGSYEVKLVATGAGGSDESTQTIVVTAPAPTVDFSFSPSNPTAGQEVTFTSVSTNAVSFEWSSVPAGFSSTEANPKYTFAAAGTYEVTLKVTGLGGSISVSKNVVVSAATATPNADFSFSPATPTEGQEVTFTNASTNATSYQWSSDPAGFSSTDANPKYTFATAGSYEITLVATGAGGTDEISKTVVISAAAAAPNADFSFSPATPTEGQEVTFTNASTNATSYQWSSVPAGFSSTEANPKYTFATAGSYEITLVATGAGGTDEISKTVVISAATAAPTATFTYSPQNPEAGEDVTFTNTSQNATSYLWTFTLPGGAGGRMMDNTFTSTETNPVIQFPSEGSWQVTLRATGEGGETTSPATTISVAPETVGGGGDCDLPNCYVTRTVTNSSGATITVDYTYTTINGQKVISKLVTNTSGVVTTTDYEYNAQGQNIKQTTSATFFGFTTISVINTLEYDGLGRVVKLSNFNGSNVLQGYTTTEYDGNSTRRTKDSEFSATGVLEGYVTYENYDAQGNFQLQRNFNADGSLNSSTVLTYQNCLPVKLIGRDATGNVILDQTNTIDGNGLLRTSNSVITAGGTTTTANTNYTYDCD